MVCVESEKIFVGSHAVEYARSLLALLRCASLAASVAASVAARVAARVVARVAARVAASVASEYARGLVALFRWLNTRHAGLFFPALIRFKTGRGRNSSQKRERAQRDHRGGM